MIDFLQAHTGYYIFLVSLLSLCVGSFLNVVIYRLPLMLQAEWKMQCANIINLPNAANEKKSTPFNLWTPRSHCPHCKKIIPIINNFPLLSFLLQKRRCLTCKEKISWRYFWVEILSAFLAVLCAFSFGVSFQAVAAMIFCFFLITLIFIDLDSFLLPDDLTLMLLWLGLLVNIKFLFATPTSAIIGAALGYLILWSIGKVFFYFVGIEGMGYGDYKLTAAIGAWFGWQTLPWLIFIAAMLALIISLPILIKKKMNLRSPIPFGPFLAISGLLMLFWNALIEPIFLCSLR